MAASITTPPLVGYPEPVQVLGQGDGRVDALKHIDLQVYAGQVVGLLGPSGSGKSTLLNVIGCILEPSSGRVALDGQGVLRRPVAAKRLRRLRLDRIGFIFQFHNLLPFLNVLENVAVVLEIAGAGTGPARQRALAAVPASGAPPRSHALQPVWRRGAAT